MANGLHLGGELTEINRKKGRKPLFSIPPARNFDFNLGGDFVDTL